MTSGEARSLAMNERAPPISTRKRMQPVCPCMAATITGVTPWSNGGFGDDQLSDRTALSSATTRAMMRAQALAAGTGTLRAVSR
eukprot:6283427-Prymnesium_polylepis.1